MNTEKKEALVTIPKSVLLNLVANKFKDTVFFQESIERARKFLDTAKLKTT